jgi:hypothetical protein
VIEQTTPPADGSGALPGDRSAEQVPTGGREAG